MNCLSREGSRLLKDECSKDNKIIKNSVFKKKSKNITQSITSLNPVSLLAVNIVD